MATTTTSRRGYAEFVVNKFVTATGPDPWLRNSVQYRESLRDGRHVIVDGRDVPDVTQEPSLARGVD
jgi:hypothetical protein